MLFAPNRLSRGPVRLDLAVLASSDVFQPPGEACEGVAQNAT